MADLAFLIRGDTRAATRRLDDLSTEVDACALLLWLRLAAHDASPALRRMIQSTEARVVDLLTSFHEGEFDHV